MLDQLPLWAVSASLLLNALFLKRLLHKLDTVYNWICGTPQGKPGAEARLDAVERATGLVPFDGVNRRRSDRRRS